jgi:replicative DNA helicase
MNLEKLKKESITLEKNYLKLKDEQADLDVLIQAKRTYLLKDLELMDAISYEEDDGLENLLSVEKRVKNKPIVPKYLTGNSAIDNKMGGFSEGSFINIAGENFTGKTTLVLKILSNIAEYSPVLFFSFEMYENLLVRNKFKYASKNIKQNLFIEQNKNDLATINFIIRKEAKKGLKFFAIDSRMKIKTDGNLQEYQKNSLISQTLSKITQELGVIIILINQIALSDLRSGRLEFKGSGDTSYDSDVNFFILKDEKTETRTLICSKDRINERTWKEDITDRSYLMPKMKTFEEPEINTDDLDDMDFF